MKITIETELPDDEELGHALIQYIRDFDTEHVGKLHFRIFVNTPNMTLQQVEHMLDVEPPFAQRAVMKKQ